MRAGRADIEKYVINKHAPAALAYEVSQGYGPSGGIKGNFLMTTYSVRNKVDLSPTFYAPGSAIDSGFKRWSFALDFGYPGAQGPAWEYAHIDSVVSDGDGYLVSLAYTDRIFLIWASDVSVFDPGIDRKRLFPHQPAAQDARQAGTATLIRAFAGSRSPGRVVLWQRPDAPGRQLGRRLGDSGIVDEFAPTGVPVLRIAFAYPYSSYRAVQVQVVPGQLSLSASVAGMNAINPRRVSGSRSTALSSLRASYARPTLPVRFSLAWLTTVRFTIAGRSARWSLIRATTGGSNTFAPSGRIAGRRLTRGQYARTATPLRGRSSTVGLRVDP